MYKTKVAILLILCNIYFSNILAQNNCYLPFSYSILSKDTLQYELISFETIREKNIILTHSDVPLINKKTFLPPYEEYFEVDFRDSIQIMDIKYDIKNLLCYQNSEDVFFSLLILNAYVFKFDNRKFIAVFLDDVNMSSSLPNSLLLLFEIINNRPIYLKLGTMKGWQASMDIKCLNDFNNDGNLDYADWQNAHQEQTKIMVYSLKSNKFVLNHTKYLSLIKVNSYDYIKLSKSKWFFNLYNK